MLVPSRGWTGVLLSTKDAAAFALLGPFYRGQIIERLVVGCRANGNIVIEIGAVVTWSDNASVESWRSGAPILQRSTLMADGQPVYRFGMGGSNFKDFVFAVGRAVRDTPKYVVCRVRGDNETTFADVYFSAFCFDVVSEGGGGGTVR